MLLKVEEMKTETGRTDATKTANKILREVFGDKFKVSYGHSNEVCFKVLDKKWNNYGEIIGGILLTVGGYGETTVRKVMAKNNYIDTDLLKAKYAELKIISDKLKTKEGEQTAYNKKANDVYKNICKELDYDYFAHSTKIDIFENTPETITLSGYLTGNQIKVIENIIGEQKIKIDRIQIPVEKAVQVYNAIK